MTGGQFIAIFLFLLFSALFGMFGIGGGAVYTPVQLFLGTSFNEAATLTLFLITVTSFFSGFVYIRAKLVDTALVAALAGTSFVGSIFGGWSASLLPESLLLGLFSFFLFVNGVHLTVSRSVEGGEEGLADNRRFCWQRTIAGQTLRVYLPIALPTALLSGLFGGMVGLGGGIVMLPLMIILLRFPIKVSIACSSFLAAFTGLGGFLSRLPHYPIDWRFALFAAAAVATGSMVGARRTVHSSSKSLRRLLGLFFVAIAVVLFLRGG